MQTIKTFVVIGLLLAVCYGAFVALNAPVVGIPEELQQWASSTDSQSLDGFEIPSLEMPDNMFGTQTANAVAGAKTGQTAKDRDAQPEFPVIDTPTFAEGSLPQFPDVDSTRDSSLTSNGPSFPALPQTGTAQLASPQGAGSSSGNIQSPLGISAQPDPAVAVPVASKASAPVGTQVSTTTLPNDLATTQKEVRDADVSIPSGAKLTSSSPSSESAVASAQPGPSIPFNPESSLPPSSSANDLISAANAEASALEESPSAISTTIANNSPLPAPPSTVAAQMASSSNKVLEPALTQAVIPFRQAREQSLQLAQQGKLADALELMSQYYESPELGYAEHTDLVDLLDALSREVIYSNRHILSSAYAVTAQDSLESIAEKHRITPELLAAINQLGESQALVPSTMMKVLDGPFRAQISLSRGELTLFLRKMYAGRFPISISKINKPSLGNYEVIDRRKDRTFYGANTVIPAGAPNNPFGKYWLSLGSNLAIHGSPEQVTSDLEGAGCMSLAPLDAADAYRILGKGAAVEVRP